MFSLDLKNTKKTFLVFFCLLISGFFLITAAEERTSSSLSIADDPDQDSLNNEDELKYGSDPNNPDTDGDGYNDGAEVRSGYDPTIPAPGDKLDVNTTATTLASSTDSISSDTNITEEVSNQIAAMIADGSSTEGISMDKINSLIEENIASRISFSELPEIDESTIKILEQNYSEFSKEKQERKQKEDNEAYLSSIFYTLANNLPHSINSEDDISSFTDEIISKIPSATSATGDLVYFNDLAERGSKILSKMSDIEVPQDMLDIHKEGLQLATYAILLKDKVKIDNSDPLASIIGLSEVENLLTLSSDYITRVESKIEELDLTDFVAEQDI